MKITVNKGCDIIEIEGDEAKYHELVSIHGVGNVTTDEPLVEADQPDQAPEQDVPPPADEPAPDAAPEEVPPPDEVPPVEPVV